MTCQLSNSLSMTFLMIFFYTPSIIHRKISMKHTLLLFPLEISNGILSIGLSLLFVNFFIVLRITKNPIWLFSKVEVIFPPSNKHYFSLYTLIKEKKLFLASYSLVHFTLACFVWKFTILDFGSE